MSKTVSSEKIESDAAIERRLAERFDILGMLTEAAIEGDAQAAIISGPPGLGKSFTIDQTLAKHDPNGLFTKTVKGYVRATGLYKLLYSHRQKGQVLVFDDADTVFFDETSLNLLKGACDTTKRRVISWLSEAEFVDEESGDVIPSSFEFCGVVLFLTNIDFDSYINKGHKLAPHLSAMISRAHYIDLSMKSARDFLVRIRMVVNQGLLKDTGLSKSEQAEVVAFIEKNYLSLRELSLRIAIKLAGLKKMAKTKNMSFESLARITCCK